MGSTSDAPALVLSCEHAVASIPARYRALFPESERLFSTHRAYDRGALEVARTLARRLGARLIVARTSRLLVDLNRSEQHPACFSRYTRALDPSEREHLLARYHRPYREAVLAAIDRARGGRTDRAVLHLSVHSFTPVYRGQRREADVGLLYDPARPRERELAARWRRALLDLDPGLRVRSNYPYRGTADGLTTQLRRHLPARGYLGLELELSQRLWRPRIARTARLIAHLAETLGELTRAAASR